MRLIDADVLLEQMKHRRDYVGRPSDPVCLVEDAPTVGGWVSVEDRLPDDTKQKIVFHKRGVSFAYFSGNYWWSSIGGRHSLDTVTHWMPLPKPPKEDEKHGR